MVKRIVFMMACAIVCLFTSQPVQAHIGSVSFVRINGQLVKAGGVSNLDPSKAQDFGPQTYLVGVPLSFSVDTSVFGSQDFSYRWSFDNEPGVYAEAPDVTKTFNHPGTNLATLELKSSDAPDYLVGDVIAFDVAPNAQYRLPAAKGKSINLGNQRVGFEVEPSVDSSTSIKAIRWNFGDETSATGTHVEHSYQSSWPQIFKVIVHVEDTNGLYIDKPIAVDTRTHSASAPTNSSSSPGASYIVTGFILAAGAALWLARRSHGLHKDNVKRAKTPTKK